MNAFALATLASSVICISLGIVVYSFNRRALLNKVFVITSFFGFVYAFTEVMMWQSSNFENASFWSKMGSIWPFFVVLVLHFALVFTGNKWLKNKLTFLFLYLPAGLLLVASLFTNLIYEPPIVKYWGYDDFTTHTVVSNLSMIWVAVLPVLAFILCSRFYRATSEQNQRQQRKFVAIAFGIPVFTYLVTNVLFPLADIRTPNLGHFAVLFFSIFAGYGILKYELFTFDAALAAENILAMIPDSLVLADMKGKMLRVNKGLVTFLDYGEDELIGKSITKLCAEELQCEGILKELLEKRVINNYELNFKTKLGQEKNVLFSCSVVRSKTGRDIGISCVIHDITNLKHLEQRLVKAERLASIGELAGQIGHDLRNPLTGIKSGAYFLRKKGDGLTEADRQKVLEMMDSAVEDSNRIISSLVDYASDFRLEVSTSTPKSILSNVLTKIQIPSRIEVINNALDEPEIFIDVGKIENVFTRIIRNALESMPQEGILEMQSIQNGEWLNMVFVDSGIGIPENVLPKIFSPLITTKAKGMGLGLAICKRVIDAHGGKISVESAVGKGTTIIVTLPAAPQTELAADKVFLSNPPLRWSASGEFRKSYSADQR
jgi:PAS domain S-box-containing protein